MISIEYLFKSYYVRLCTFAYSYVKSEDLAKDMVQEAFIVISQNEDILYKDEFIIKSYLYGTVKNICLNYIKRENVGKSIVNRLDFKEDYEPDYLNKLIKAEIIGELHNELIELPEKCQHICRLIYLENKKYEEVAQLLNISVNTVKTQRARAINYLKIKLSVWVLFILLCL